MLKRLGVKGLKRGIQGMGMRSGREVRKQKLESGKWGQELESRIVFQTKLNDLSHTFH